MDSAVGNATTLVINSLGSLYVLMLLVRFSLAAAKADFYNPLSQAIARLTNPIVVPIQRIIPSLGSLDFATLLVAIAVSGVATKLMLLASGFSAISVTTIISWCVVGIIALLLNIYFWSLVISVVASFIAPFSGHPALLLISQLLSPFYKIIHRFIPPMGGLDFSPLFMFLAINVLEILVVGSLVQKLGINVNIALMVIGL
jgi:YggT family protein